MEQSSSIERVNQGISGIMTPEIPLLPEIVAGVERPVICLNDRSGEGKWEFRRMPVNESPALDAVCQDFDFTAPDQEEWAPVIVPGELEMQGFELKNNTEYYYRTVVSVPEDYAGCRCMLRFDGVYSNARVWVNGRYVRSHQGGFTTWYCDITEYVVPGESMRLAVGIADLEGDEPGLYNGYERRPLRDPSFASNYAHHNIGGILRDVSLVALPGTYLARLHTNVTFDDAFQDAVLSLGMQVNSGEREVSVNCALLDQEGKECLEKDIFPEGDDCRKTAAEILEVREPRHWDAEHPYLYTLRITLSAGGEVQAVYREKIGFREIWFSGKKGSGRNKVYVNGKQVKLRGTCRHDIDFKLGRSTTEEEDWAEIRAYKEANINHVRTSHYPASRYFLEACDALGMYVEQENAACFQGGVNGIPIHCAPECFVGEFTEMVERDRNHASILMWSLGNESGFEDTEGYRREFDYIRGADDSRPVIFSYPFTVHSLPRPYDIYSMHYADVDVPMGMDDIPVLHDEYMHISCYNIEEQRRDPNVSNYWGQSIRKAWERIFETDGALGGDLWGGIDDIFYLPDNVKQKWQSHSKGKAAGYGPWGSVLDIHRRWKTEAYLTKKAYSPVRVRKKDIVFADEKILIPVKNWFDHTNLNELELVCRRLKQVPEGSREQEEKVQDNTASEDGLQCEIFGENGQAWQEASVSRRQIREDIPPHARGVLQLECAAPGRGEGIHLQFYKGTDLIEECVVGEGHFWRTHEIREIAGENEVGSDVTTSGKQGAGSGAMPSGRPEAGTDSAAPGRPEAGTDSAVPERRESGTDTMPPGRPEAGTDSAAPEKQGAGTDAAPELQETETEIIVTAGRSRFFFDKETARMTMAQYNGQTLLSGGPHLLLTGTVLGEWRKAAPGVRAERSGNSVIVTLTGRYSNGYLVWYTITIDGDGRFVTGYQTRGGWTDEPIRELGVWYDLVSGAEKITWRRKGQYSCYPGDHIGRNCGTAYRRNEEAAGQGCGAAPGWSWKEDMWDDFLCQRSERGSGLVTRDFKALRENIRYFNVHFQNSDSCVRVEDQNAQTAARVSVSVDENGEERTALLMAKRWVYPDLGWGNEEKRRFYAGAGTYGSVVMRLGDGKGEA